MPGGWHVIDGYRVVRSDGVMSGEYIGRAAAEQIAKYGRIVWPEMAFEVRSTQSEDRFFPKDPFDKSQKWYAAHDYMGAFVG